MYACILLDFLHALMLLKNMQLYVQQRMSSFGIICASRRPDSTPCMRQKISLIAMMLCASIAAGSLTNTANDVDSGCDMHAAAESGDAQAQFNLALDCCIKNADATQEDYAKAVEWFRKAAEQGHGMAQAYLGSCYANGYGVLCDYAEAVKWFRKAADQQQVTAQNALGYCYANGHGVPQDSIEAIKWYRLAAEQNDAQGQYNLGYSYYHGQGIAQDYTTAVKWLQKAANLNYAPAQYLLGLCLTKGQGVEPDIAKAFAWLTLAARTMDEAAVSREELVAGMTSQQIFLGISTTKQLLDQVEPRLQGSSIMELQLLASRGNTEAQLRLGDRYAEGRGVDQNMSEAIAWWTKAAELNNAEAQFKLGTCYAEANGVERNLENAVQWYSRAANQSNAQAQYRLGYAYYTGQGVEKDYNQAKDWFQRSAELNYAPAQYQLGLCSANGQGMQTNLVTAFAWWSLALDTEPSASRTRESLLSQMNPQQIFAGMQLSMKLRKQIAVRLVDNELRQLKSVVQSDKPAARIFYDGPALSSQNKQESETASSM